MTELDTLGKRLYYLRQSCNKTLQEVSDSSHISRSNLGKYEKDIVKPTADAIISLSNFYRISADWILIGKPVLFSDEISEDPEIKEIHEFTDWFDGIINTIRLHYSNGFMEGHNNKIKVLKRVCFGIRNFHESAPNSV